MANDKLRVPGPDEGEDEPSRLDGTLVISAVLSCALALGFFVYRLEVSRHDGGAEADRPEPSELNPVERASRRLEKATEGGDGVDAEVDESFFDGPNRLIAAFEGGPRPAAETACRARADALASGELDERVHRTLLKIVDRRTLQAPWTCLTRLYLEGRLSRKLGVYDEIDALWSKIEAFRTSGTIAESILAGFRDRGAPDSAAFERWVRLCGLNFQWKPGRRCRRFLRSTAPEYGSDLLEVVETHLRETDLNPTYDIPLLIHGLKHLGNRGQPAVWTIESTDELPDYDADLRIGAAFYLCRFMQAPTRQTRDSAARALGTIAGVSTRKVDLKRLPRWSLACRYAFQQGGKERDPKAPLLEVARRDDGTPRYSVGSLVEQGKCETEETTPVWYCGARAWQGKTIDALDDFFVKTRFLQWKGIESPLAPTSN
ncbi:MAG: hypothetical protein ABEL76_12205 [Bradymonadaceae bacterium]